MLITVIDYGSGNLRSATKAFEKAAAGRSDITIVLTDKAEDVLKADRIVLPGQGAFADCMQGLSSVPGMIEALHETVIKKARPFFGICVGMQLLATRGLEHGEHQGLNWIPGTVRKLEVNDPSLKIPHMGWNNIRAAGPQGHSNDPSLRPFVPSHPLLNNLPPNPFVYFVHSYAFYLDNKDHELASCDYGNPFTAAVVKDNIAGTQFHPEKSQKIGLQLVQNFLDWAP
ncbi:MAG: imidazole glycerol phosphate synthase subunit HisH [Alphaproteobacteria bacterium]|nr:imidazole glycerol phosphate synthase subunit HisH [Alphaproteobacteria bacterium]